MTQLKDKLETLLAYIIVYGLIASPLLFLFIHAITTKMP